MALTQYPWLEEAAARLDAMRERLPNAILQSRRHGARRSLSLA